jgi:hypothetical protein
MSSTGKGIPDQLSLQGAGYGDAVRAPWSVVRRIGRKRRVLTPIEGFLRLGGHSPPAYTGCEVSTYRRARSFVAVRGADAEDFLQRMVSNDVAALQPGETCDALLLTPKGRLVAPLRVWRRSPDDYLLLSEPELGEVIRSSLVRARFAARCEIEGEEHTSAIVLGDGADGIACPDYGVPAREVLDAVDGRAHAEELERLRIEAGTPRWGKELDDRVLRALMEGWTEYRRLMNSTPHLKPHHIDTWNGLWLTHRFSRDYEPNRMLPEGMFGMKTHIRDLALVTAPWAQVVFALARECPDRAIPAAMSELS